MNGGNPTMASGGMPVDNRNARTIPQSNDAERSVLGSMLLNPDCLEWGVENVHASLFYMPPNRMIFQRIMKLQPLGNVDILILTDAMRADGEISHVGGPGYIGGLVNVVPTVENIRYYTYILKDRASRRGLLQLIQQVTDYAYTLDVDSILNKLKAGLADIERIQMNGCVDTAEIMGALTARRKLIANKVETFIPSGLYDLDVMMQGGFPKGYPVVIKGFTGKGKTALLLQILDQMVNQGRKVLLISLEMRREDVWPRVIGSRLYRMGRVDANFNYSCLWNTGDWISRMGDSKLIEAYTEGWWIDDRDTMTPNELFSSINKHVRDYGVEVVAIDHLNLIQHPMGHSQQDKEGLCERLRGLTKAKNLVMIELLQLHTKDQRVYYYTTAGQIAAVTLMPNLKESTTEASIEMEKCRFGPWGRRGYKFIGGVQTYERPDGGGFHAPGTEYMDEIRAYHRGKAAQGTIDDPEAGCETDTEANRGPDPPTEISGEELNIPDLDEDVDFF